MAAGISSRRKGALSEINVTPLVDVMLVLLIVFMVTTPILVEDMTRRKVEVDLPQTDSAPLKASDIKHLILSLHKDLKVTMRGDEGEIPILDCASSKAGQDFSTCLAPLEEKLRQNAKVQEEKRLFIMADRGLPYGFVVDVMSRVKKAGVPTLGMITDPPVRGPEGGAP